ncbi:MAG: UDP-N-acetylglucosamine pyrophosphorylase [Clostridia bacterium]|nr:UDP-N-acetylglucosamine pyrophosphorylase [Clostridia bacterium]
MEGTALTKACRTSVLFGDTPPFLSELFERSEYPWEILPLIGEAVKELCKNGIPGYRLYCEGVLCGEGVRIHPHSQITAPCIIGAGCEIRPGAFIRGNVVIGEGCVIGNSTELKNCILLDRVQVPHYNYVGDSILGNGAHLGAGVICSNLRSDKAPVTVHGEREYETHLRKVGAFVGDGADVGCGSVLNPGTVIGKDSRVYPLTCLRGVYPEGVIVKDRDKWVRIKEEI